MKFDSHNLFTTTRNFELLKEELGEYKSLPSLQEFNKFLIFMDTIYKAWKEKNPEIQYDKIEEKARAKREFVRKLGIRS